MPPKRQPYQISHSIRWRQARLPDGICLRLANSALAVEHCGGRIVSSISAKTDYVLAGTDMGPEKRKKAEKLGVPIISEEDFWGMVGVG